MVAILTLTTDFGLKDGNVGVMKGVIWGIAPDVLIVDLSHQIQPQNVAEAAFILGRSVPFFPGGTIHVAVVDPGVGTKRQPVAARLGNQFYVLPDNGLITLVLQQAKLAGEPIELIHLDKSEYWLPKVSHVFHGRDIFAPVAGHMASGVPLAAFGTPIADVVRLQFQAPQRHSKGWRAEIIHIDHFGNLTTNLRREDLGELTELQVRYKNVNIQGMVRTFGERSPGELVALYSSSDHLILCEVNGSAANRLGAKVGDPVDVILYLENSSGV